MNQAIPLAKTPEELSALRARQFVAGADEIARIDVVDRKNLTIGFIGVPLDAIHHALGKSEREFARRDERTISLLTSAFVDAYGIKIRNTAHLYNEIKSRVPQEKDIYKAKSDDRDRVQQFLRRIAAKLTNGHAGAKI